MHRISIAVLPLALAACNPGLPVIPTGDATTAVDVESRADEMIRVFRETDLALAERNPDAVAAKYRKMAASPFAFLRGNIALHENDWDAFEGSEELLPDSILLVNDAHPENLGTFLLEEWDGWYVVPDWTDYDGSHEGPQGYDVLRAASALRVFAHQVKGDSGAAAAAFSDGYRGVDPGPGGTILDNLLLKAVEKGDERDELSVVVTNGSTRTIKRSDKRVSVTPEVREAIVAAVPAYAGTRAWSAAELGGVLDVVQRLGKGVGSLPLLRYEVLLAGPAPDGSEDTLLQLKEAWNWHTVDGEVVGSTLDTAIAVVDGQRAMALAPDLDRNLGWLTARGSSFVVTTISGYQQGIDAGEVADGIANGGYAQADLDLLSRYLGGNLAMAHLAGGAWTTDVDTGRLEELAEAWALRTIEDADSFRSHLAADGTLQN